MRTSSGTAVSESTSPATRAESSVGGSGVAGVLRVPPPVNEPNLAYLPGSPERAALKARLQSMAAERIDIPLVIGGEEIRTGRTQQAVMPHNYRHVLADWHSAD